MWDDPVIASCCRGVGRPITTYGFSEDADVRGKSTNRLVRRGISPRVRTKTAARDAERTSRHNALNAAAAVAVATEEGIDDDAILRALESSREPGRRFDFWRIPAGCGKR